MMELACDWDHPTTEEAQHAEAVVQHEIDGLIRAIKNYSGTVIVVTNELGMGLVPVFPFGRIFRDIAGRANQALALAADEAVFMVSGLPLWLKEEERA